MRAPTSGEQLDIAFVLSAFGLGLVAASLRLPPLVGYLAAGFALHAFGYTSTDGIELVADLGVLLLLFGIGLKLRLRTMAQPEVWAGTSLHMAATTAILGAIFLGLGAIGMPLASGIGVGEAALVGFAFSFSSTVFAVKALEARNEAGSLPGRIAIGILVAQDLIAVAFLTVSVDDLPSLWAIPVVIAVVAARPIYGWILDHSGHGELLVLFGLSMAIGVGMGAFDQVGLKPDLGALVAGVTLSGHRRAPELAERLLSLKDVLLIGFFLSIGLGGAPGPAAWAIAGIALLLAPLKMGAYLAMLTRFRLRSRTAWHTSITLANYSEFGLIVVAAAVNRGVIDQQWSAAVAIAIAISFAAAAPISAARYKLYRRWSARLAVLERHPIRPEDALMESVDARTLVFGMGRVGAGAYDELVIRHGDSIIGVDRSDEVVAANTAEGRRMVRGDALDADFWDRTHLDPNVDLVVLAMGDHQANLEAVRRVKAFLPNVRIAATAAYPDEVTELQDAGVDVARNLYDEAGQGLADDACDLLDRGDPEHHGN